MNLRRLQREVTLDAVSKGFLWSPNEINTMLLRIIEEVIEAAVWLKKKGAVDNCREELSEEFADILIRLANTAEVCGIDLEAAVRKKVRENKKRPYLHGKASK